MKKIALATIKSLISLIILAFFLLGCSPEPESLANLTTTTVSAENNIAPIMETKAAEIQATHDSIQAEELIKPTPTPTIEPPDEVVNNVGNEDGVVGPSKTPHQDNEKPTTITNQNITPIRPNSEAIHLLNFINGSLTVTSNSIDREITQSDLLSYEQLIQNGQLWVGDKISTGPNESAKIYLTKGHVVWVGPDTTIEINALGHEGMPIDTEIELKRGRILAVIPITDITGQSIDVVNSIRVVIYDDGPSDTAILRPQPNLISAMGISDDENRIIPDVRPHVMSVVDCYAKDCSLLAREPHDKEMQDQQLSFHGCQRTFVAERILEDPPILYYVHQNVLRSSDAIYSSFEHGVPFIDYSIIDWCKPSPTPFPTATLTFTPIATVLTPVPSATFTITPSPTVLSPTATPTIPSAQLTHIAKQDQANDLCTAPGEWPTVGCGALACEYNEVIACPEAGNAICVQDMSKCVLTPDAKATIDAKPTDTPIPPPPAPPPKGKGG